MIKPKPGFILSVNFTEKDLTYTIIVDRFIYVCVIVCDMHRDTITRQDSRESFVTGSDGGEGNVEL